MKNKAPPRAPHLVRYFVDEAGDGVLFGPKGRNRLEDKDAPRYFMLGMVQFDNIEAIDASLTGLRDMLLSNPLYASIPSLNPKARKTAHYFHAKDDHAEIRAKVFDLLVTMDFKFFAVVKDLREVRRYVLERNKMQSGYRYHPNELYDLTVRILFKHRLHKAESYQITFAKRGKSDRTQAFRTQLETARQHFVDQAQLAGSDINITALTPRESAGLQVADYCLWALQRAFERFEVRFLHAIWPKVSLIHDVDEQSQRYGLYRTRDQQPPAEEELRSRWV